MNQPHGPIPAEIAHLDAPTKVECSMNGLGIPCATAARWRMSSGCCTEQVAFLCDQHVRDARAHFNGARGLFVQCQFCGAMFTYHAFVYTPVLAEATEPRVVLPATVPPTCQQLHGCTHTTDYVRTMACGCPNNGALYLCACCARGSAKAIADAVRAYGGIGCTVCLQQVDLATYRYTPTHTESKNR